MRKKSHEIDTAQMCCSFSNTTKQYRNFGNGPKKNENDKVDLDVDVVDNITKTIHVQNEGREESDNNMSFEEVENNTNDKYKIDEGGGNLQSVSTP